MFSVGLELEGWKKLRDRDFLRKILLRYGYSIKQTTFLGLSHSPSDILTADLSLLVFVEMLL